MTKSADDPTKVSWDMMIAFGSDEDGNEFLTAVKAHCCRPAGEIDLPGLVRQAKASSRDAGHGLPGKRAAWRTLEHAGLELLPALMEEIGVAHRSGPRAAFHCPELGQSYILGFDWRLVPAVECAKDSCIPVRNRKNGGPF